MLDFPLKNTQISFFKKIPGSKVLGEAADNIYKSRYENVQVRNNQTAFFNYRNLIIVPLSKSSSSGRREEKDSSRKG